MPPSRESVGAVSGVQGPCNGVQGRPRTKEGTATGKKYRILETYPLAVHIMCSSEVQPETVSLATPCLAGFPEATRTCINIYTSMRMHTLRGHEEKAEVSTRKSVTRFRTL